MAQSRCSFTGLIFLGALVALLVFPSGAFAVIASPEEFTLTQPDGTTFKAHKWGDERQSGWETEDGYTIVFDEKLNRWTYAVLDHTGKLVGSSFIAGRDTPPPDLEPRLRPKGVSGPSMKTTKEKNFKPLAPARPFSSPSMSLVVPSNVTANVPVILINFSNTNTTFTSANFNELLFSSDPAKYSMKDYYEEVSYGAFSISGGAPGVMGWYQASNTHDYYGPMTQSDSIGLYTPDLVYEAAQKADQAGVDFTQYDSDGDCYVDVIAVIHQGTGKEASTNRYDIWSHRWSLDGAYGWGYGTHGGAYVSAQACPGHPGQYMIVNDYIIMPEKQGTAISTIGVFAHEYGHSLGLPDLYDNDYMSAGIGKWSIMAAGSWNGMTRSGDRPAHMDAWCKYALGWVSPTEVTGPVTNAPIAAAATWPSVYQLLSGSPNVSGEYFLVENRQKVGFDAGLPGAGLLIWHIDESQSSTVIPPLEGSENDCTVFPFVYYGQVYWINEYYYSSNPSNCGPTSHYHVALVQADNKYQLEGGNCYVSYDGYLYCSGNKGDAGDPFPGTALNRWLYDTSARFNNSNLYNGPQNQQSEYNMWPSNVIIGDISNSGPVMTASMAAEPLMHLSMAPALDDPEILGSPLSISTDAGTGWYGQALVSTFGGSAAKSGDITDGQSSAMTTSVTGPASVAFRWKVSSQPSYDYVSFKVNGAEKARISGSVDWQPKGFLLPAGQNTLTWTYVKNGSLKQGMDAAWVDKVVASPYTKVTVVTPNGGGVVSSGTQTTISWTAPATAEKFKLFYTINNGTSWIPITPDYITGPNPYTWTVPAPNGNKTTCKVKVMAYTSLNAAVGSDVSDKPFTIEVVKVNSPNGKEVLASGEPTDIDFTLNETISPVNTVDLAYTVNGGLTWLTIATLPTGSFSAGDNTYSWTVPPQAANKTACKVRVTLRNAAKVVIGTDMSDANFGIEVVKVNLPNGGELVTASVPTDITYTINQTISPVASVLITYTIDNGVSWKPAVTGTITMDSGLNTVSWTPSAVTAVKTKCKVKVTLKNAAKAVIGTDMSDGFFTIRP